ncbi:hypothetical protein EIP91_003347 [Steccherinum ochraceum]|uniref:Uncharacterized protein n=1 Tax=Steccherinum ochraceum TaxID=92696 RepID=A0A4R0RDA0_9APHY|nr:hypothetical protein EIP91_003347 [Steccherinum ochraceum]
MSTGEFDCGHSALYLPNRLFAAASAVPHVAEATPLPQPIPPRPNGLPTGMQYPVPPLTRLPPGRDLSSKCTPLHSLPLRTRDRSQTSFGKHPAAVENLPPEERLLFVKKGSTLWQSLIDYTETDTIVNTWRTNMGEDMLQIPSQKQQAEAVIQLIDWAVKQSLRPDSLINSEMSVDDVIGSQLLEPIDLLLQTRYSNTISQELERKTLKRWPCGWQNTRAEAVLEDESPVPSPAPPAIGLPSRSSGAAPVHSTPARNDARGVTDENAHGGFFDAYGDAPAPIAPKTPQDAMDESQASIRLSRPSSEAGSEATLRGGPPVNPLLVQRYPANAYCPSWSRGISASHRTRIIRDWARASFPDRLLLRSANLFDHGVLGELKTPWAISDQVMWSIFSHACAASATGRFRWRAAENSGERINYSLFSAPAVDVLKQIWCQLICFKTNWGFFCNGSKLMLFVKTDAQELTLTEPHDLGDDDVLQALLGLCFASLDHKHGSEEESDLISVLCPADSRKADWSVQEISQSGGGVSKIDLDLGEGPSGSGWDDDFTYDDGSEQTPPPDARPLSPLTPLSSPPPSPEPQQPVASGSEGPRYTFRPRKQPTAVEQATTTVKATKASKARTKKAKPQAKAAPKKNNKGKQRADPREDD